jgi:ArsR family transcriptional regulator
MGACHDRGVAASRHQHPRRAPPRPPADAALERAAALFRAVGDVARLRLLHVLADDEWCVSELAAQTGTKLSTLSQQLRLLHAERIVERRRDGKHVYYRLADAHVRELVGAAIEHAEH